MSSTLMSSKLGSLMPQLSPSRASLTSSVSILRLLMGP